MRALHRNAFGILGAVLLVAVASSSFAYDPYHPERDLQDPAAYTRTRTNTLAGSDVREYGERMQTVRQHVFKSGTPLSAGTVRETSQPNMFEAEAQLDQFSDGLKSKIISS